ncbi:MAG TPA: FKBP-type peptidyl-prolyl cis-trans isomerase [Candidatus Acidoferrum sp.]
MQEPTFFKPSTFIYGVAAMLLAGTIFLSPAQAGWNSATSDLQAVSSPAQQTSASSATQGSSATPAPAKPAASSQGPGSNTKKTSTFDAALYEAANKNQIETVRKLISQGADVNAKGKNGWPALVAAASDGHVDMVRLLLESGAEVDAKEKQNGGTALFWAAFNGKPDVVKLLLDKKANPNLKSSNATTPLMATALSGEPPEPPEATRITIADLLLKHGAKVNEPSFMGGSARGAAASNGFTQLAEFLKQHGGKCVVSLTVPHNCTDEPATATAPQANDAAKASSSESTPAASTKQAATVQTGQGAATKTGQVGATKTGKAGASKAASATATNTLTLSTPKDKTSYAIGMNIGKSLKRDGVDVDPAIMLQAMKDEMAGDRVLMTDQEAQATLTQLQADLRKAQELKQQQLAEANKKEGDEFLAANKTKEGVVTLPDGLQYKIMQEGTGPKPAVNDAVTVNYRGTLLSGIEFDSSYKRGQPATFNVGGIIKGWTEALQLMPVGSKWQLFIPADLAYGARQAGPTIGPSSTLVFEVELLSIQPKAASVPTPVTAPAPASHRAPSASPAPTPTPTPTAKP